MFHKMNNIVSLLFACCSAACLSLKFKCVLSCYIKGAFETPTAWTLFVCLCMVCLHVFCICIIQIVGLFAANIQANLVNNVWHNQGRSQGCGLGLNASVSRPPRGVPTPRLGLASVSGLNASCNIP